VGDRAGEGRAYSNLGSGHHSLGNFKQAKDTTTYILVLPENWGTEVERGEPMQIWAMLTTDWGSLNRP